MKRKNDTLAGKGNWLRGGSTYIIKVLYYFGPGFTSNWQNMECPTRGGQKQTQETSQGQTSSDGCSAWKSPVNPQHPHLHAICQRLFLVSFQWPPLSKNTARCQCICKGLAKESVDGFLGAVERSVREVKGLTLLNCWKVWLPRNISQHYHLLGCLEEREKPGTKLWGGGGGGVEVGNCDNRKMLFVVSSCKIVQRNR